VLTFSEAWRYFVITSGRPDRPRVKGWFGMRLHLIRLAVIVGLLASFLGDTKPWPH
jgi:hypothetical protein